jgi:hypothetical protein
VKRSRVAAAFLAVISCSPLAFARTRALAVTNEGCDLLDGAEVERVLGIELGAVAGSWTDPEPLNVELHCEGQVVRVLAIDRVTDKRLSREIDLAMVRADRDRTVALIASQLFLTSWAERLLVRPTPELPPEKPAPPAIAEATDTMVRGALAPPALRPAIAVMGGPRLRSFGDPLTGMRVAARPLVLLGERTRLFIDLSYERGAASRASGSVTYLLAGASAGASYRFWQSGRFAFNGVASAGVFYVDLSGDPATRETIGSRAGGTVGEGGLGFGPTIAIGAVRVGAELAIGLAFPRAVARVAGDNDLKLSGLWTGANLIVAFEDR